MLIIDMLENQNSGKNDLTHVSIIPKATTPYVFMHYIIFSCSFYIAAIILYIQFCISYF